MGLDLGCASAKFEQAPAGTTRVGFKGFFLGGCLLKICPLKTGKTAQHGAKERPKGRKSCVWNNHLLISRVSCPNPRLNRENNALLPTSRMGGWPFPVGSFFLGRILPGSRLSLFSLFPCVRNMLEWEYLWIILGQTCNSPNTPQVLPQIP